jgi:hypothetical protein
MRAACAVLATGVFALQDAFKRRNGLTDCILAAEHAVLGEGAQDVRSLFSTDGGRTLRPFESPLPGRVDALQVYLAVRRDGYWADAFVSESSTRGELTLQTRGILDRVIAAVRPGMAASALWAIVDKVRGHCSLHPLTLRTLGGAIGLSLDDGSLTRDCHRPFAAGEVYSLHIGLLDANRGVFASAILHVTTSGAELLWPVKEA